MFKYCKNCKEDFSAPGDHWYSNGENKFRCKNKTKNYRKENILDIKNREKVYRDLNKSVLNKRCKDWRIRNKDRILKEEKQYRLENIDRVKARKSRYKAKNRDNIKILAKQWRKNNPDKVKAFKLNRRAYGKVNGNDIINLRKSNIEKYGMLTCVYCEIVVKDYHIDHKLPVSRGGTNDLENLAISCPHCNLSKHTKTAEEFIDWRKDNSISK